MGITFFALLPKSGAFAASTQAAYSALPTADADEDVNEDEPIHAEAHASASRVSLTKPRLSTKQKLEIATPLFLPFMIPLFVVYFAEVSFLGPTRRHDLTLAQYTVNTGVSPTLLYPVPNSQQHPILGSLIHKLSDCEHLCLFPGYLLTYLSSQTTLSGSWSTRLGPRTKRLGGCTR